MENPQQPIKPKQQLAGTQTIANPQVIEKDENKSTTVICKNCQKIVTSDTYFCPNCGKKVNDPPYKFSVSSTLVLVLESALLPPLGLIPGIRYMRKEETGAKILGISAIIITILSLIITTIFLMNYINSLNRQLNQMTNFQELYNNPNGSVQNQVDDLQNASQ